MWYNLIFGLILIMFVPRSEGLNWIGTFNSNGSCDTTKCCCPSVLLVDKDAVGTTVGFSSITGAKCPPEKNVTIDTNKDSLDDTAFGQFKITSNNRIEITIYQTGGSQGNNCTIIMKRENSTDDDANSGKPGGNNNKPGSTGNEASLNHSSILIKFISLIMTTIFLKHI